MEYEEALYKMKRLLTLNEFSKNTIKVYLFYAKNYINYLKQRNATLENFDRDVIEDYFLKIKEDGISPKSRSLIKTIIMFLYRDILRITNIRDELTSIRIKLAKREVRTLTHDKAVSLINSITNKEEILVAKCLYIIGMRVGEIPNLTVKNVKEKRIIGKGNKERSVFLPDALAEKLLDFNKNRNIKTDLIFPYCRERRIQKFIKKYSEKMGLENITPHTLRKSFTTNMINSGEDPIIISRYLGHDDVHTTEKHYIGKMEIKNKNGLYF